MAQIPLFTDGVREGETIDPATERKTRLRRQIIFGAIMLRLLSDEKILDIADKHCWGARDRQTLFGLPPKQRRDKPPANGDVEAAGPEAEGEAP